MSQKAADNMPITSDPRSVAAFNRGEIRLSGHATERYQERVRPALDLDHASGECVRVIGSAELRTEPPGWLNRTSQHPAFYICLGDVAMPADHDTASPGRLVIRTVLTRAADSPRRRAARQRRRNIKAVERRTARAERASRDRRRAQRTRRQSRRRSKANNPNRSPR